MNRAYDKLLSKVEDQERWALIYLIFDLMN